MEASVVTAPSINGLAGRLVERLMVEAAILRVAVERGSLGHILIDAGAQVPGGIEAGLRIAEICMGGLGRVHLAPSEATRPWRWTLAVSAAHPVIACLASQYAGWSLTHGEGQGAYSVLGSGPGRAMARKEPLYGELGYEDRADRAIFVLETGTPPPDGLVERIAADCGLAPEDLVFIYAPTESLAGSVQVTARVLEVALHKAHELRFPLARIVDGMGAAPLAPPGADFIAAMGRTNDAIIFGGHVHLFVTGSEDDARDLANRLPSSASRDYGRPFAEIFKSFGHDFYAIDPLLFSPAAVTVTALASGRSYHAGRIDEARLNASFS